MKTYWRPKLKQGGFEPSEKQVEWGLPGTTRHPGQLWTTGTGTRPKLAAPRLTAGLTWTWSLDKVRVKQDGLWKTVAYQYDWDLALQNPIQTATYVDPDHRWVHSFTFEQRWGSGGNSGVKVGCQPCGSTVCCNLDSWTVDASDDSFVLSLPIDSQASLQSHGIVTENLGRKQVGYLDEVPLVAWTKNYATPTESINTAYVYYTPEQSSGYGAPLEGLVKYEEVVAGDPAQPGFTLPLTHHTHYLDYQFGQPTAVDLPEGPSTGIDLVVTLNQDGTTHTHTQNQLTTHFQYDLLGRVTQEQVQKPGSPPSAATIYEYAHPGGNCGELPLPAGIPKPRPAQKRNLV